MPTYTTSPTETLRPGDVVVLDGKKHTVSRCPCCTFYRLIDEGGISAFGAFPLSILTELVRQKFAKLAPKESPKEVPPLAVGQKWRKKNGKVVTVTPSDWGDDRLTTDDGWWYRSHMHSKVMHIPGDSSDNDKEEALVELIADVPATDKTPAKDEVTLVLSKEEAQAVYQVIGSFVIGNGPARKHTSSVFGKLDDMGFNTIKWYPLEVCPHGIFCCEIKEPLFRLNEVWRTEKKYLVRVCMVRPDGTAFVRTIHNPKGAAILYGDEGTREVSADGDILASGDKLIEKISD